MEQLLWTFDDIVRFVTHPDTPLRRWALGRLEKLFPDRAAEPLVHLLADSYSYIVLSASQILGKTGEGARYGPILLDHLRQTEGNRFGYLAQALAQLDFREALPAIAERLDRIWDGSGATHPYEYMRLVGALGVLGGDLGRQALWALVERFENGVWAGPAIEALLKAAGPQDVARLVQTYRSWPPLPASRRQLASFAAAAGADRLLTEIEDDVDDSVDAALQQTAWVLGRKPKISDACLRGLNRALEQGHHGVFEILLDEACRIARQKGDDIDRWRSDWEADALPAGYRRRTSLTLSLLDAFARYPSPHSEQRSQESALGLALLFQWSQDRDDLALLAVAEDETEVLLDILTANREHVLPGIIERVAALGPSIVPRLLDLFDPESFEWGPIRIADVITHIARRHPGSCDAAIPVLIEAIYDDQGDFLLESCSSALDAIGPAAVPMVSEYMWDDDLSRQIYLLGVLSEIPTESAAQAILSWIEEGMPVEEMHITSLATIGSPSAIAPLRALWTRGEHPLDNVLAEALLVLCELNGIQRPELPQWRRAVQLQEAQFAQFSDPSPPWFLEQASIEEKEQPVRPVSPHFIPRKYSSGKPQQVSKPERTERSTRRKKKRKRTRR